MISDTHEKGSKIQSQLRSLSYGCLLDFQMFVLRSPASTDTVGRTQLGKLS